MNVETADKMVEIPDTSTQGCKCSFNLPSHMIYFCNFIRILSISTKRENIIIPFMRVNYPLALDNG